MESERHIIQIDEISVEQIPVAQPQISQQKSMVPSRDVDNLRGIGLRPVDVVDRYCSCPAVEPLASPVASLPISVGLRRRQKV